VGFVNGCWVIGWGFCGEGGFFPCFEAGCDVELRQIADGAGFGDSRVFYTSWKQDLYDLRWVVFCASYISPFEMQFFSNNHGEVMKVRCE
jgi:hypothetical protein